MIERPSLTPQRSDGRTILENAIDRDQTSVVEYLRSVGAHMSLHDAASVGDVAVVQAYLLANPACVNKTHNP